jgi:hypothetical protein
MKRGQRRGIWRWLSLSLGVILLSGCAEVMQQVQQMATLTKCQFRLISVERTTLAGIPLQGDAKIGLPNLLKLERAYSSGTLPLDFTLNVEVKNPNASAAGMSRLDWILFINGERMTTGVLERSISVAPNNGLGTLPIVMALDLKKVLSGKSLDALVDLARDVAGEGTNPTKVSLQVKPSIMVGGYSLQYPSYVTVTHDFPTR